MSSTDASRVDVRGPRFAAWITTAALVAVLIISGFNSTAAAVVLSVQAAVFAVGALSGPRQHPYAVVFARVVRPRLAPPTAWEPAAPLQFAQFVGLVFAVAGIVGFAAGPGAGTSVGQIATASALVAALLNAAFGICLGCRLYPLVARLRRLPRPAATAAVFPPQ